MRKVLLSVAPVCHETRRANNSLCFDPLPLAAKCPVLVSLNTLEGCQ
jgi:hypothetical protein